MLIILQSLLVLLLGNEKKILPCAFEVFSSTLLKAFDGFTSAILDNLDVAVSDGEVAPLYTIVLETPESALNSLELLSHGLVSTEHLNVIGLQMLFLFLFNHKTEVLDLSFSSLRNFLEFDLFILRS